MHEFGLERCYFENQENNVILKIRKRQNISVWNVLYEGMFFKIFLNFGGCNFRAANRVNFEGRTQNS
jgi:hypothetical protein